MGRDARARLEARRELEVVIGSPRGGGITHAFSSSLYALQHAELRRPFAEQKLVALIEASGLYIEDNRHFIARRFLNEHRAPWLLMIDSDIEFPTTLLDQLLEHAGGERLVLAGNVPLGSDPCVGYYSTPQPGVFMPLQRLPEAKVFEVDAAATAIMLIHRRVLEVIREREGECWFFRHKVAVEDSGPEPVLGSQPLDRRQRETLEKKLGRYPWRQWLNLGEDISFCLRARAAGFPTWVVRGLEGVKHHKTRGLTEER